MTAELAQGLIVTGAGLSFGILVLMIARRGLLTLRYTLGWFGVAACTIALVFLSSVVQPLARAVGITPTGVLLAAASAILLLITLQITVALSALREAVQTLTESQALLEERVARLDRDSAVRPAE